MTIYLGLGTNLGDKTRNLLRAADEIGRHVGHVCALSSFYRTDPWGFTSPHTFLNACAAVDTALAPLEVLRLTQGIERALGREAKSSGGTYADRVIDIDLLLWGDAVLSLPGLVLPHPLMHLRRFVMEPLAELAPDAVHPVLRRTMRQLLQECPQ